MSIMTDIVKELLGMFLADARLTASILTLVAMVGGLVAVFDVEPLLGGGVLLLGCLAILIEAVVRETRLRHTSRSQSETVT
jgi:hypothetical protein